MTGVQTCALPIYKIEVDALGLAQLQRRIKDSAQAKAKARAREKENALGYRTLDPYTDKNREKDLREFAVETPVNSKSRGGPGTGPRVSVVGGIRDGGGEDRGGVRRRYLDLSEMHYKASILLSEYHAYADIRKRNQVISAIALEQNVMSENTHEFIPFLPPSLPSFLSPSPLRPSIHPSLPFPCLPSLLF